MKDTECTHAGCQGDTVTEDPRQAKVCDLHLSTAAQQHVTGLQVTMHDSVSVKEVQALQQLLHYVLIYKTTGGKEQEWRFFMIFHSYP